jgi:hypothetical protein
MSSLEERQAWMRLKFASDISRHIHQPWEDYSVGMPKRRCEECNAPFITMGSVLCGQCQARKKEFDAMLQCLTLPVTK